MSNNEVLNEGEEHLNNSVVNTNGDDVIDEGEFLPVHNDDGATLVDNPKDKLALFVLPLALLLSLISLIVNAFGIHKNGDYHADNIIYTVLSALVAAVICFYMFKRRKRLED